MSIIAVHTKLQASTNGLSMVDTTVLTTQTWDKFKDYHLWDHLS